MLVIRKRESLKLALSGGTPCTFTTGNSGATIWNWKARSCPFLHHPRGTRSLPPFPVPLTGISQSCFRRNSSTCKCIFGVFVGRREFRVFLCRHLGLACPCWDLSTGTWLKTAGLALIPLRCSSKCSDPVSQPTPSPTPAPTLNSSAFLCFSGRFCSVLLLPPLSPDLSDWQLLRACPRSCSFSLHFPTKSVVFRHFYA